MQEQITPEPDGNSTVYTLDDLSKRLKRTVESVFDHVRVRAEVSRPTRRHQGISTSRSKMIAQRWMLCAGKVLPPA